MDAFIYLGCDRKISYQLGHAHGSPPSVLPAHHRQSERKKTVRGGGPFSIDWARAFWRL